MSQVVQMSVLFLELFLIRWEYDSTCVHLCVRLFFSFSYILHMKGNTLYHSIQDMDFREKKKYPPMTLLGSCEQGSTHYQLYEGHLVEG